MFSADDIYYPIYIYLDLLLFFSGKTLMGTRHKTDTFTSSPKS